MFGWLARVFGGGSKKTGRTDASPTLRPEKPVAAPVAKPPIYLGWRELIDADSRIAGYRLEPRRADGGVISGGDLRDVLVREAVKGFAEQRTLIVPVTAVQWSEADFSALVAKGMAFLLVDASTPGEHQAFVASVKGLGARVAVDVESFDPLPELAADWWCVDFSAHPMSLLETAVPPLLRTGAKVVATGIRSWPEHRLAISMGCAFCAGTFPATRDEAISGDALTRSRLVVIDLLNALRSGAETSVLAQIAKRDPAIIVSLLQLANSPMSGLQQTVNSLESAIMVLGRESLYRWLAVTLFRVDGTSGRDQTLLVLALGRAFFLEALFGDRDPKMADELFLLGLLSVVDSLFGQPMTQALSGMRVPEPIRATLETGDGPYARYLALAVALERCQLADAVKLAGLLDIDVATLIASFGTSLAMATSEIRK